jgi:predicted MFS family arabinose efflux permease
MNQKTLIWLGLFVGSAIGGWIPSLWGENFLSMFSVLLTAIGGLVGVWAGFKLGQ